MQYSTFASIDLNSIQQMLDAARGAPRGALRDNPTRAPLSVNQVYDALDRKDKSYWLLSTNPKVEKGLASKFLTGILHFAAGNTARKMVRSNPAAFGFGQRPKWGKGITPEQIFGKKQVCPDASPGCLATCLVSAGHGGVGANARQFKLNQTTEARIMRQLQWQFKGEAFFTLLLIELVKMADKARRKGLRFAARLNGTSDIPFERFKVVVSPELADWLNRNYPGQNVKAGTFPGIFQALPKIIFYDYTKSVERVGDWFAGRMPKNYHLTLSLSELPINRRAALSELMRRSVNVAVSFDTLPTKMADERTTKVSWTPLPYTLGFKVGDKVEYFEVFDADEDDLRFLDERRQGGVGRIAGLRFKLPLDPSKKAAVEKTDFRLRTMGQMEPVIGFTGNVINPGRGWKITAAGIRRGLWPEPHTLTGKRQYGIRHRIKWTEAAVARDKRAKEKKKAAAAKARVARAKERKLARGR